LAAAYVSGTAYVDVFVSEKYSAYNATNGTLYFTKCEEKTQ